MRKSYKQCVKFIEAEGYELDRTNCKGIRIFRHTDGHEISISPSLDDRAAKQITRSIQKRRHGYTDRAASKRNPAQIKNRQAADRERASEEVARHQAELTNLIAQRDARMNRAGFTGTDAEFRQLLQAIEQRERELKCWQRLMTEVPRNENRARHRA